MMTTSACTNCNGRRLYRTRERVGSGDGYAPNFLPGLGTFWTSAKVHMVVCQDCGLTRMFAAPEALEKLPDSKKWERI